MMKYIALMLVLIGLSTSSCSQADSSKESSGQVKQQVDESEKLPDFTLKTLSGESVHLRSMEGQKIVVVNFWATWCGPCRREIPAFNKIYAKYRKQGVEFLGISLDHSPTTRVPAFTEKIPIDYPILAGNPDLGYRYGITALPTTYIIDRNGRVAKRFVGLVNEAILETELEKLL